jgi:hypothetical protein
MKSLGFGRYTLAIVAAAMLAGCGGSQPPVGAPGAIPVSSFPGIPSLREPHSKGAASRDYKVSPGLLYVALSGIRAPYDQVNVYDTRAKNPSPLATITDGVSYPQSACMDSDGTLYVTNQGSGAGWVSEYPLGKTEPSATITDGISGPGFCAIDRDGNLWVANIFTSGVVEYEKGSTSPYATISKGIFLRLCRFPGERREAA